MARNFMKTASRRKAASAAALSVGLMAAQPTSALGQVAADTLPTGGQIVDGSGSISQSGNTMTVTQASDHMIANWNTFNIGSQAHVDFRQPDVSAIALNRILDQNPSQILGNLTANGQVFLLNPNGVIFGQGSRVDVGGLVASTLNMSNADFMAGRFEFSNAGGAGRIDNHGSLSGKVVALIAPQVSNQGTITTTGGTAALASGDQVRLDFTGDGLVTVTVDQGTLSALVENKALIQADGGLVIMTAKTADTLLSTVVNNEGVVQARTLNNVAGRILLLGDMDHGRATIDGTLDASAPDGGDGGFIDTSAARVRIADSARIRTASAYGAAGHWLIDPYDFTIAATGGDITATALQNALANGHVTIQTQSGSADCTGVTGCGAGTSNGNGDIHVNEAISWSSNNALTLNAWRNININEDITATGASGKLVLEYGQNAAAGFANTATYNLAYGKKINLQAGQNFDTKFGSDGNTINWTVITQLGSAGDENTNPGNSLQGLAHVDNMNGNFALGADIDASGIASFIPIGTSDDRFRGKFDGLGHTISNLKIVDSPSVGVGLFGSAGTAEFRNVTISGDVSSTNDKVGGLLGHSDYFVTIINAHFNGTVYGLEDVGGLVGWAENLIIRNSSSSGTVQGQPNVGGLIGHIGAAELVQISYSFSTADVIGDENVGGLIGRARTGNISNSYASGDVTGFESVGGLIGRAQNVTVDRAYSSGQVSGSGSDVSGFIGRVQGTTAVTRSFWDSQVTTLNDTSGVASGQNTAPMQSRTQYFNQDWDIVEDPALPVGYPLLRWAASGASAGTSVWVIGPGGSGGGGGGGSNGGSSSGGSSSGGQTTTSSTTNSAVSSITAPQTGINGTGDNTGRGSGIDTGASNAIIPGGGSKTVGEMGTRSFVAEVAPVAPQTAPALAIPRQGAMILTSGAGTTRIVLTSTGNTTTLTIAGGHAAVADQAPVTTPALPVFTASTSAVNAETAVSVIDQGSALSVTGASGNGTGLTGDAAMASAAAGASAPTTNATLALADGTAIDLTVSVTAEGVLVVKLPEHVDAKGNEQAITLLAMAAAKELGVSPDALRGVLIQAAQP